MWWSAFHVWTNKCRTKEHIIYWLHLCRHIFINQWLLHNATYDALATYDRCVHCSFNIHPFTHWQPILRYCGWFIFICDKAIIDHTLAKCILCVSFVYLNRTTSIRSTVVRLRSLVQSFRLLYKNVERTFLFADYIFRIVLKLCTILLLFVQLG